MVARAVMKAWQASLQEAPSVGRVYRPQTRGGATSSVGGWQRPDGHDNVQGLRKAISDEDPEIRVAKRDDIVPKRRGIASELAPSEGFWSSHQFWKGIVVGAVFVLLVKTMLAARAPYGIDWFGF